MKKRVLIIGGSGYIGSRLAQHVPDWGYELRTVDENWFDGPSPNLYRGYDTLGKEYLSTFHAVIFLAGHSSVPFCDAEPNKSFMNNCLKFFHFAYRLNPDTKFIYASSGSVYGAHMIEPACEYSPLAEPLKPYDFQKQTIDRFMNISGGGCTKDFPTWYGLRFGTVCGYSPNPRNELLINSMVRSAKLQGKVTVTGSQSFRAVLGLNDLTRAIRAILDDDSRRVGHVYNLASFSMKIHDIGDQVSRYFHSDFTSSPDNAGPYSFQLSTARFEGQFGFKFEDTPASIAEEAAHNDFTKDRVWRSK